MKNLFPLLLFSIFLPQNTHSQTVEKSLSSGFVTSATLIKPYDTDKWLIAGRGAPFWGAYFQDTLFVTLIGNDGEIHLRKNLTMPPGEVHFFRDLLALPDGGILACFEKAGCDVTINVITVQRLDAQGEILWEKTTDINSGENGPPENWFVAADGNLLGATYNQVWKVDVNTGDILWKADWEGVGGGMLHVYEFELIPGTEDFFALGDPSFQVWRQVGTPAAPSYILEKSLETTGFRRYLGLGPNGQFYCWQVAPSDKIERINLDLQLDTLPIYLIDNGNMSLAFGNQGLYLTESRAGTHRIRRFDLNGQNPLNLLDSDSQWLNPLSVAANNGWVGVVGADGSGATNWPSFQNNCTGAWFRSFSEAAPTELAHKPDAAITGIMQHAPIDTVSYPWIPPAAVVYSLIGGDFEVKVTNQGSTTIQKICVNVTFGFNEFYDICPLKPSKQKQFSDLNLAPGDSAWFGFGDIFAEAQANVPTEICFWTSSPNEQPDAVHENDHFCHPVAYVVSAKEPDFGAFSIAPNPADQFADLTFQEDALGEPWQVFDALGRQMSSGVCPAGQTLRLETAALPNGFYLFQVKNRVGKLLVQH